MSGWRAGAASVEFEIPIGTPMAGYMDRHGGSTGTLDSLQISALVLSREDRTLVLIAADLLGVDRELVREVETAASIAPGWLALCASHTHSGPAGITKQVRSDPDLVIDTDLRQRFVDACAEVTVQARLLQVEVTITYGSLRTKGISANRNAEFGPFDPSVHVFRFRDHKRYPIATLIHFACHPTILPATSNLISADFPGAIRRHLPTERFGMALFTNGAAGDVSTRFTRKTQDEAEVERVGKAIADAVRRIEMYEKPQDEALDLYEIDVDLAPRDPADIEAAIADARSRVARSDIGALAPAERRIAETRLQGIAILEQLAASLPNGPVSIAVPRWKIGQVELYGIPGELFASLGELCTQGDDQTLILGYTNGYLGYFADRAAYDDGLYEALASPFAPGAGEAMVETLLGDQ